MMSSNPWHCVNKCMCQIGGNAKSSVKQSVIKAIKDHIDVKFHPTLDSINQHQRTVFFVGAGASVESGLPNFRQFSEHMILKLLTLDFGVPMDDMSMFVSELRPEVLLQTLHGVFGDKIFEFYDWFDGAEPSTNHYILARVLREGGLVLTTNVDVLIEKAYEELYGVNDFDVLVSKDDFDNFTSIGSNKSSRGALMKFHGTVDLSKSGLAKYETVRFLLDQVGEGMSTGMHEILKEVCEKYDLVFLGYSGCDNFSVQPVLCHTASDQCIIWMWYEWREDMVLESSEDIYVKELNDVGTLVSQGKSFNEINRGMETLSTCEVLIERKKSFRLKGRVSEIMHTCALPDDNRIVEGFDSKAPNPVWTKCISSIDRLRCAAKLYSRSGCTDKGINYLEKAYDLTYQKSDKYLKAEILKELGNEYAKASTSEYYNKALICYDNAIDLFNDLSHSIKVMETLLDKVNVLRRTRRFDEAEELLVQIHKLINGEDQSDVHVLKIKIRKGLMEGLVLGMDRRDKDSREKALGILKEAAELNSGFVGLQAALLNASGLIKYQMAGNSIDILESGVEDLNAAFRLNKYIGDARSCFQQMRNVGLIHAKLSRLQEQPELLEKAIEEFKSGEKFLFRLSRSRIMGELLEIRFRQGESLVAANRFSEAEPILVSVRDERIKLGDWHNEARTLELLVKCAINNPSELTKRAKQIKAIYEDALTNEAKQTRFAKVPITANNGRQILQTASDLVYSVDLTLSIEIQKLSNELFAEK